MDTFKNKNFIHKDDKEDRNSLTSNSYIDQNKVSEPYEEHIENLNCNEAERPHEKITTYSIHENKIQQLIDNESQYISY